MSIPTAAAGSARISHVSSILSDRSGHHHGGAEAQSGSERRASDWAAISGAGSRRLDPREANTDRGLGLTHMALGGTGGCGGSDEAAERGFDEKRKTKAV